MATRRAPHTWGPGTSARDLPLPPRRPLGRRPSRTPGRPRSFQIAEGPDDVWFPGYDTGQRWNGWAQPRVTLATAQRLVRYMQKLLTREEDDLWEWLDGDGEIKVTTADGFVTLLAPERSPKGDLIDVSNGYCWIWKGDLSTNGTPDEDPQDILDHLVDELTELGWQADLDGDLRADNPRIMQHLLAAQRDVWEFDYANVGDEEDRGLYEQAHAAYARAIEKLQRVRAR